MLELSDAAVPGSEVLSPTPPAVPSEGSASTTLGLSAANVADRAGVTADKSAAASAHTANPAAVATRLRLRIVGPSGYLCS